jgi:hypothetical protein
VNKQLSHVGMRAVYDTASVVAVALVFVLAWAVENIPDGTRRLTSFAACILFVVFFHDAARSWRRVRAERDRPGPSVRKPLA